MMRRLSWLPIAIVLTATLAVPLNVMAQNPFKGKEKAPKLKTSGGDAALAEEKAEEAQKMRERNTEMEKKRDRKMKKENEKLKGLDKQQEKKAEQVQKELGKGSEKGQAMRGEKRKKWWKFGFGKDDDEEEDSDDE